MGNGNKIGLAILYGIGVFFTSCVEKFVPEVAESGRLLVVEGHVSDKTEPYTILLSRTAPLNSTGSTPESGAIVSVSDSKANSWNFVEKATGSYVSDPHQFVGKAGEVYQLDIFTANDQHYQSAAVLLKPSPPVDSVYWEREVRFTDTQGVTEDGVNIFVDSHDPDGETKFYRYQWTESYEVRPYYSSGWDINPLSNPPFTLRNPKVNLCFVQSSSTRILVTNTVAQEEDRVSKFKVNYVNTEGYRLRSLYHVQVQQYALDENAYRYWSELQNNSERLGTLFDPTPYPLQGNVHNVQNPEEVVLGYFEVGGVSENGTFIEAEALKTLGVDFPRDPCRNELDSITSSDDFALHLEWGYLLVSIDPVTMIPPECGDCRYHGTLEPPSFWPR